eukprot:SAG11_NODE_650_length_7931_cov_9.512385_2_plen_76_part_00
MPETDDRLADGGECGKPSSFLGGQAQYQTLGPSFRRKASSSEFLRKYYVKKVELGASVGGDPGKSRPRNFRAAEL